MFCLGLELRFAVNQLYILFILQLISRFIISVLLPGMKRLVLSANIIEYNLELAYWRSFTNIRKRRGPRTDPCGTPTCIINSSDL